MNMKYAIFDGDNLINTTLISYLEALKLFKKIQTSLLEHTNPKLYELKELHHIDERIAFERGEVIEYRMLPNKWTVTGKPSWGEDVEYRVKPKAPTCQVKIGIYTTNISQVTIYRIDETFNENSKAYGVCVNTDGKEVTIITDRNGMLTHWNNKPMVWNDEPARSNVRIDLTSWRPL